MTMQSEKSDLAALEADLRKIPAHGRFLDEAIYCQKHPFIGKLKHGLRKLRQVCFWLIVLILFDASFVYVTSGGRLPHL